MFLDGLVLKILCLLCYLSVLLALGKQGQARTGLGGPRKQVGNIVDWAQAETQTTFSVRREPNNIILRMQPAPVQTYPLDAGPR